ncbi:hypothetical protein DFR71_1556 [Nocardia alba]|uniref:Uncharacterized protein n=2 Tax=Nocardia alba TaxID=225051 RepID=A0A4R1G2K1_9NOCA|nr:hypothetical protein DFR71_1556 [Nocardia alba]
MQLAAELAGEMVAQAVQWVSEGTAGPFLAYLGKSDARVTLVDLTQGGDESPLDYGRGLMVVRSAARGVMVYDGAISNSDGEQFDALIGEVYEFQHGDGSFDVLVPYRPVSPSQSFGVYALMLNDPDGQPVSDEILDAFLLGTRRDADAGEFLRQHQLR